MSSKIKSGKRNSKLAIKHTQRKQSVFFINKQKRNTMNIRNRKENLQFEDNEKHKHKVQHMTIYNQKKNVCFD